MTEAVERTDRRGLRRQQTIEEILEVALDLMAERGVGGLALSEVARRIGVQPPSLYKYFPSLHAIYDELFARGQRAHLDAMSTAVQGVESGLAAVTKAQEAGMRWAMANLPLAQLLFWRPVPGFEPSEEAFEPSKQMVELFRTALRRAVRQGELGPGGASQEAMGIVAVAMAGVSSQYLANEPGVPWERSVYVRLLARTPEFLRAAFPPR
ncbi:TetR/AcrR family transcriptional regulator [Tenggerimyces flavus]|uniref:TetR/AcrR family transcriptional regulator n=1 Tax=Tenggerimyces flavus TaxID=1708749 RepID=A0ABV7YB88_9ACTN|nr:TetR/AcrR family transcriptional regulator [Tenggerimyces flavus]MBM7785676.1 AcrR family transcriptional regulator [Tenggerimyces flavus]